MLIIVLGNNTIIRFKGNYAIFKYVDVLNYEMQVTCLINDKEKFKEATYEAIF